MWGTSKFQWENAMINTNGATLRLCALGLALLGSSVAFAQTARRTAA